jgi:hypothetical protein
MIKRTTLLIIAFIATLSVFADGITQNQAKTVARAFLHSRQTPNNQSAVQTLDVRQVIVIGEDTPLFYAINFEKGGFVLVSATDAAIPVLGYSPDGEFSLQNQSPSLHHWIEGYELQLDEIIREDLPPTPGIVAEWNALINYVPAEPYNIRDSRGVEPLLPCTWNQGSPYNDLCPEDITGPGGHVYSGCVATAMSQIIYYWRFPLQGTGSSGYYSDYGYLFVDFSQAEYKYEEMTNSISADDHYEMAEIQYHCGVAVDMMYSGSGSGAYSFDAVTALRNHFGYSNTLSLKYKDDFSEAGWAGLLMQNLDNGWPMYYNGYGSGGHAFNVDGYQGDDYFHFNWGWGGSSNGYFYLNNLNPGGSNFTEGQGAIVNFIPAGNYPYYCDGVKTLANKNGTIEDGSGPVGNYTSGLNCGWVIAPNDSVTGLTLNFEKFELTEGLDVLNVFDGPDASYPLLASLTGNEVPSPITASGDRLFIEFLTSGDEGSGFRLSYQSNTAEYCNGITTLTEADGVISDGSGSRNYNNNSVCRFKILPEDATSITFNFNYLDTEPGSDVINIYDLASQDLIGSFSGSEIPSEVIVPSGKALLLFSSNDDINGGGWEVEYSSSVTTVGTSFEALTEKLNVKVFPIPANDWLRVNLKSSLSADVSLSIYDISGRQLVDGLRVKFTGQQSLILPVGALSDGIYYLRYTSSMGSGTLKIVIRK